MPNGIQFELQILSEIRKTVESGGFGLSVPAAKVFHRKRCYSRDQDSDIVFDISIEVFRPNATIPWLIWLWECKDYKRSVPVDDVEEFHAKLQQVGSDRTKGTIITNSNFQSGAFEFAKSHGIGLARHAPNGSMIMLVEAVRRVTPEVLFVSLTAKETTRIQSLFYGMSPGGAGFDRLLDYLVAEIDATAII